jgi:Lrp/AsnC family transcriptional regulator, regulator for asnA, asnC and gidA
MPTRLSPCDSLDYEIIQALNKDARLPASEIARSIGANERTVRKRIERLVSEGYIRLVAILDPIKFGYVTAADIFLEVDPSVEEAVLDELMAMPEVTYIAFGQGNNEVSIEARFKDNQLLREFIRRRLVNLPGVTVTRYTLVPRILRNIDEWMPGPQDFNISDSSP